MFEENNNEQNNNEPNSNALNSNEQNNNPDQSGDSQYRYGKSYYVNQQDSVYNVDDAASQEQNTTYQSNMDQGQTSYQTYNAYNQQNNATANQQPKKPKKKGGAKKVLKVAASFVLVAAIGSGSAFATVHFLPKEESSPIELKLASTDLSKNSSNSKDTIATVSTATTVVTDVSDVVENVMPSVVSITNVGTQTYNGFFGQSGTYESESSGSGIIIGKSDTELLVVTNQHVVSGADKIKVIFIDEESCEANVKGTDVEKDLAVIAIPISSLKEETLEQIKVATLGDSDNLKVGEPAIAIGNALGYGQSVTTGVISALNREVTTDDATNTLIQTDAAINPGNSGGALMNIAGEVIGINSVKYASTEVEGMGYAIPISDATPIINELMNKETKTKVDANEQSYLGISGVDITSDVAQSYNMPKGVYVAQVEEDSPADVAGLEKGDIITKIADVSVTSFDELKAELEYHAAGTTIKLEIQKQVKGSYGYETKTIEVTLAKKEK